MRISDWSSDVCSSDLDLGVELHVIEAFAERLPCGFAEVARRDMLTATVERQRDVVIARQRLTADADHVPALGAVAVAMPVIQGRQQLAHCQIAAAAKQDEIECAD